MELLHAEELEKRVGHRIILDGVSLDIAAGSCTALLGPNGAGKSTLVKVLAGISKPTAGKFWINGKNPTKDPAVRNVVGVALHESMLYGDLSAEENLLFYGRLFGVQNAEQRAEELLEAFGLNLFAGEYVRTFSRGMTQRLSLARSLMHRPQLLFLDEIFAGLDLGGIDLASHYIAAARDAGMAIVMVTHELPIARRLANRVLFLASGRIAYNAEASTAAWAQVEIYLAQGGAVR